MSSQVIVYVILALHNSAYAQRKALTTLYKAVHDIVPSFSPTHVISPPLPHPLFPAMLGTQFPKHMQPLLACRYFLHLYSCCIPSVLDTSLSFFALGICFSVQILTYCHRLEAILDEKEAFPQSSKSESFVLFPLVHAVQFTMTYFSIVNFYATSSTEILPWWVSQK